MALSQKNKHKPVSRLSVTQKCLSETFHCKAYHTSQFTTGKILLFVSTIHSLWLQQELRSDQIRSVAQSCLTLCDPMNCSTPGLPVHHQLPEFTQTHVHRVTDAIQPSHPLSSPSPPAPNPSQHQSLFQRVNSSHPWDNAGLVFSFFLPSILLNSNKLSEYSSIVIHIY